MRWPSFVVAVVLALVTSGCLDSNAPSSAVPSDASRSDGADDGALGPFPKLPPAAIRCPAVTGPECPPPPSPDDLVACVADRCTVVDPSPDHRPLLVNCAPGGVYTSLSSDGDNCGACGNACGNASPACVYARCTSCPEGYAHCAGDAPHQCGTYLTNDNAHCGACGVACGAGALCVSGRCVATPLRLMAPISATYVTSARPWLRWALAVGVDGARVEVCATPSCDRIEGSWTTTDTSLRVPEALAPGVHFWRAFARRGAVFEATPSAVWEFVVPPSDLYAPERQHVGYLDLDGDDIVDRVATHSEMLTSTRRQWSLDVFLGGAATPSQRIPLQQDEIGANPGNVVTTITGVVAEATGDLNGDGFGDLIVSTIYYSSHYRADGTPYSSSTASFYEVWAFFGGPPPLANTPALQVRPVARSTYVAPIGESAVWPARDLDGDGYGDVIVTFLARDSPALNELEIRGGASLRSAGRQGSHSPWESASLSGDFDADGDADVVELRSLDSAHPEYAIAVVAASDDGLSGTSLFACAPSGLPRATRTSGFEAPGAFTILDADDDGYDDLRIDVSGAPGGARAVLYRGGAGGLATERCGLVP